MGKVYILFLFSTQVKKGEHMKKYLLLIEDEKLWDRFKSTIQKDINTEIMELIREKANFRGKKNGPD
jgi:hypothetical protein